MGEDPDTFLRELSLLAVTMLPLRPSRVPGVIPLPRILSLEAGVLVGLLELLDVGLVLLESVVQILGGLLVFGGNVRICGLFSSMMEG